MSSQTSIDFSGPSDGGPTNGDSNALTLAAYAQQAYLEYALSVVKGRALPSYSDGQKPVQRRILYAMKQLGLGWAGNSGAKPVKGAKVVGDVLGDFHPHGDQSVYDALVRMAQDFSLRYPLIDGHGNFGSRDGDGAAAMRYTEARLAPIARLLLDEIDEDTVDFRANYDGRLQEPVELPARLPFVLLNGASGIAVGLMQITPETASRYATPADAARLIEPRINIHTGARMLADLMRRFGRIDAALAAWNAGEGAVRRAGNRVPDIDETQAHVQLVLELYWALLQQGQPARAQRLAMHP